MMKIFVLTTFEWPFYTGFTVFLPQFKDTKLGNFVKFLLEFCSMLHFL